MTLPAGPLVGAPDADYASSRHQCWALGRRGDQEKQFNRKARHSQEIVTSLLTCYCAHLVLPFLRFHMLVSSMD